MAKMKPADGILEIKCPFSIAGEDVCSMPPAEITRKHQASFCLQVKPDGGLQLKRNHKYYTQVQGELAVKGRQWADFVVWTLAPADNIFVERIMADESFWRDTFAAKAGTVLHTRQPWCQRSYSDESSVDCLCSHHLKGKMTCKWEKQF